MINKKNYSYDVICPNDIWEDFKKQLEEELIKKWKKEQK